MILKYENFKYSFQLIYIIFQRNMVTITIFNSLNLKAFFSLKNMIKCCKPIEHRSMRKIIYKIITINVNKFEHLYDKQVSIESAIKRSRSLTSRSLSISTRGLEMSQYLYVHTNNFLYAVCNLFIQCLNTHNQLNLFRHCIFMFFLFFIQ